VVTARPSHEHPYLAPHDNGQFIAFAHRGGTDQLPENTIPAFRHAIELGYRYLETDVQLTRDGYLVAFHDNDLFRTCQTKGRINEMTWQEVSRARVDGKEPIPLLAELLEEFPDAFLNIDSKSDPTVGPLIDALKKSNALPRVCIGSFSHKRISQFRVALGNDVCTSASPVEVVRWISGNVPKEPSCFQVPSRQGPIPVVTPRTVRKAQSAGKPIHVWTIDDAHDMQRLIDLGVDGLMTDQSITLKRVLEVNNLWNQT
jgi:glycerophosphoryl diester phosphodiesterase